MSDKSTNSSFLRANLQQLQSRFTWDLQKEEIDLENLNTRLEKHIILRLGGHGAVAISYSFLAYVRDTGEEYLKTERNLPENLAQDGRPSAITDYRYLQGKPEEAQSLLLQSEQTTRECYGEGSEKRLIVTYGDLAWLNYNTGDVTKSNNYCQRVHDILIKYPSTFLHPEVYGEKGWTYLKFSRLYYPKAIDCFKRALEMQKNDSEWNAGYAIALFRTESYKPQPSEDIQDSPAIRQLRRALEINPDDGVLMSMLALKLAAYQNHQEAERLVEKALRGDPDNPHVLRYVAKYLRNQGDNNRSIKLLERALEKSNTSAFIHHQLGLCFKKEKIKQHNSKPSNNQKVQQLRHQCIQHLQKAVGIKSSFVLF